jgi:hypothetical protein
MTGIWNFLRTPNNRGTDCVQIESAVFLLQTSFEFCYVVHVFLQETGQPMYTFFGLIKIKTTRNGGKDNFTPVVHTRFFINGILLEMRERSL